jgi:hypothetical protein
MHGSMTLEKFKTELLQQDTELKIRHFLRKHVFHGIPFIFQERENDYYEVRNMIAEHFGLHFQEVLIIGSGKLGFSYLKEKEFNFESDIDVAIINEKLFEEFFQNICTYQYSLDKFRSVPTIAELEQYTKFLHYLVKGWMRPDLLPLSFDIKELKDSWFSFFQSLSYGKSCVGDYKVTAGLYKSFYYFELYHYFGIKEYYNKIKN